ncbi:MAG: GNAT family N-acetyltransferase [Elainellaceae cyanobacterium]
MNRNPDVTIQVVTYGEAKTEIQAIRCQVFQQEQGVSAELEFDGLDDDAVHLLAYDKTYAVGTARMRNLGDRKAKVERVAVLAPYRGQGIGRRLMMAAIEHLRSQGVTAIKVNAQLQVKVFYERLGFEAEGGGFEEAGIPHVAMWLKSASGA